MEKRMARTINRIVMHHSAGALEPSQFDLQHYHRMVTGHGEVLAGRFPISANAIGRHLAPGTYAAHTLNLNGGAIGLALAAMANAQWNSPRACPAFPTRPQMEAFVAEAARLCVEYDIDVTRRNVLSHAEVQITLGVTQRGKWDLDYDPFGVLDSHDPVLIGDMLRERIAAATGSAQTVTTPEPDRDLRPTLRRGDVGSPVAEAQRRLLALGYDVVADSSFGRQTEQAVREFQTKRGLGADGVIGPSTWSRLMA
jgi:N-acetyl-anhydromuramyl-L-alanine amidase AmpD